MDPSAATAYKTGLIAERERWIVDYLPLVSHVVGRLAVALPPHLDRDDLLSVGIYGLIQATRSWDASKGASFKAHAFTRIRGAILDELRRADTIPKLKRERAKAVEAAHARLTAELGSPPCLERLAEEVGATAEEIEEVLALVRRNAVISLDSCETGGDGASLAECVRAPRAEDPACAAEQKERLRALAEALGTLPPREREVVGLYYYDGLLLREIGVLLGISESRVCQIHTRAVYLLNRELASKGIRSI